jgi:hypothetical protein
MIVKNEARDNSRTLEKYHSHIRPRATVLQTKKDYVNSLIPPRKKIVQMSKKYYRENEAELEDNYKNRKKGKAFSLPPPSYQ